MRREEAKKGQIGETQKRGKYRSEPKGWIATAIKDLTSLDVSDSGHGKRCYLELRYEKRRRSDNVCVLWEWKMWR